MKETFMYEKYGIDESHKCKDCSLCVSVQKGNRRAYKCLAFGNTNSAASDWQISSTACKNFNGNIPETPIIKTRKRGDRPNVTLDGQLTLF